MLTLTGEALKIVRHVKGGGGPEILTKLWHYMYDVTFVYIHQLMSMLSMVIFKYRKLEYSKVILTNQMFLNTYTPP